MAQDSPENNQAKFDDFADRLDGALAARDKDKPVQDRQTGNVMGLGLKLASELLAALIVGGVLGFGVDYFLGTTPLFLLGGLALGCAAAFVNVLRMMKNLNQNQESADQEEKTTER